LRRTVWPSFWPVSSIGCWLAQALQTQQNKLALSPTSILFLYAMYFAHFLVQLTESYAKFRADWLHIPEKKY
jgi:hypothetical protein